MFTVFIVTFFFFSLNTLVLSQDQRQKINWHEWNKEAFLKAKQQDKMIFVDIGMEGCTACRWMDEDTYNNTEVIKLVNDNFIAIQVDAESRPDIGERYSDWAWPATIFMSPEAVQVLAIRGNKRPRNFIPILNELIKRKTTGRLSEDENAPYTSLSKADTTELMLIRNRVRLQIDNYFDDESGAWGFRSKSLYSYAPVFQLLLRSHVEGNQKAEEDALKTIRGMTRQIDPVWGGIFVATINGWENFIPEKRIAGQAAAMFVFAEAFQLTGDEIFLEAAGKIDLYLRGFLQSKEGTFFTSQEDDAPGLPANMDARDYYNLTSDGERKKYGIPPIDHAVYTDFNGMVISAYVRLYESSGDPQYLSTASRAALTLINERLQNNGWILQSAKTGDVQKDKRMRKHVRAETIYLRTQAYFGQALLDLYRVTAQANWIETANKIGSALITNLEDQKLGGFFSSPATGVDSFVGQRKPIEDNAVAARFLYELSVYTKEDKYRKSAEKAIRAVALPEIVEREGKVVGNLAVALEILTSGYVEFSIVGDPSDKKAQQLYQQALAVYEPRKILHYEKPGRYPDQGKPSLFICNENACSPPILETRNVAVQADKFKRGLQ